jgi:hypothetical protein
MNRRFSFLAVAAAAVAALALSAPARAGSVNVTADSGGGSTNVGANSGFITLSSSSPLVLSESISSINNVGISPTLSLTVTATIDGASGLVTGGSGSKLIDGTTIDYTITGGVYSSTGVIANGTITSVTGSTPGYVFSPLVGGTITITLSHSTGGLSGAFTGHALSGAVGLGVQEASAAVPEPASIAMLGIGMTGLLAIRRLLKRSKA